jgi:hypothetical protein
VKRITASELPQRKLRMMLHRQQRWRQRLNLQRRTRQSLQPNTSAATKALNASLVFIYRYPRNIY